MEPYEESLYGRGADPLYLWDEVGENRISGPDIVEKIVEKIDLIKKRIRTAQSRQKSYTDKRRKDLEFEVGDEVFLKLSPRKGLINPKKGGKLSPRYVGPYKILQRIGKLAYKLELPAPYAGMHDVFHVSRLKKYQPDPEHIITRDTPPLMENLSYTERPIRIIDQQIRQLRKREIPMVKVVWQNHNRDEDATWEMEEDMRNQYPELF
ncbi:hypothetical protein DH2020_043261 [Rehmannia glutinosa]|uniref:Tf2-1-like SH3-like domain-containing protein n=1 Tax=Rehmannia glutinosa TaxID=99300 RepID=A0ABR0UK31_REHGL